MKIKLLLLVATVFSTINSFAQNQTFNNVSIGTDGPAYGTTIKANFPYQNGGWARGYGISNETGNIPFIQFGSLGGVTNGVATIAHSYIGKSYDIQYMTFLPSGNIGIGTTTPGGKLDVNGSVFLKGKSILDSDGTSSYFNSSAASYFQNMGTVTATITSAGYFGIGTLNPIGKFDVRGNVFIGTSDLSIGSVGSFVQIDQGLSTGNSYSQIRAYSNGGNINNHLVLQSTGGNVGIGTTSPVAKLTVAGNFQSIVPASENLINALTVDVQSFGTSVNANASSYFRVRDIGSGNYIPFIIKGDGNVGIGSTNPDQKLTVKGKIHSEEIIVDLAVPADYVFQKYYTGKSELKSDYVIPTLAEIEKFTKKNHHLPNVPSAQEIKQNGLSLGEMSNVLLQKVEELTLYAIEQQKELERLKTENKNYKLLAERVTAIEKELKK